MAGSGEIKIPITADARDVIRATDDVEEALDDVADALDDMTRDTKRSAEKAEDSVDDLADTFRDAQRRAKDLGDEGDDAGDKVKRGMKRAEDGVEEFKDEANSTAKEAAASFDGSAESIADVFQELAANAFAGFGPAGAVAGLAAAVGIGLAVSGFEQVGEAEQESRERAAEWAQAFVEAGSRVLSAATTTAKAVDIATDAEKYKIAADNARNWGVDVSVAIAAMAGETWALNAANDSLQQSAKKINDEMSEVGIQYDWAGESMTDLTTRTAAGQRSFDQLTGEMALGVEQADALSQSLRNTAANTEGATTKVDEFGDAVTTLPDGTRIYVDAETGQATTDLDKIEKKIYGVPDGHSTVTVTADTSQVDREIRRLSNTTLKIGTKFVTSGNEWDG
ncbi:hypothetical protein ACYX8G_14640 [Microbacterium saperdae]